MGFFSRVANVWSGILSLFVSDMETNNAEAVYESAIEERIKRHRDLKKAVSGIVYLRNKLQGELEDKQKKISPLGQYVERLAPDHFRRLHNREVK